jgi:hypothetical protein
MLTQAARRAFTTARAMRRASIELEHVTRTNNLSVKTSSSPVTVSLFLRNPTACNLPATLQYFAGDTTILFAK